MANVFDQFDSSSKTAAPTGTGNQFDKFDNAPGKPVSTQDDYTIEAKTGDAARYDPYNSLPNNFIGGISDVASGIMQALTPPDPDNPGGVEGLVQAVTGLGKATMGAARTVFSPIQAAGDAAGEVTGEAARSGAQSLGMGPDASAAIGTAIGAPINAAIQLWAAPYAIAKAAPSLMKAVQAGAARLPGAQVTLRDIAAKAVEAWPTKFAPPRPSKDIYAELAQTNPSLSLPEFNGIAKKLAAKEAELADFGLGNSSVGSAADKIGEATNYFKQVPFDVVQKVRSRIGARIGELRTKGGEALGEYKQLYKGISESLENAANNGVGAAFAKLKEANKAANREFSIGELQDIITKNIGKALEGQEFTSKNFAKTLNDVNAQALKDPLFEKGLGSVNLKTVRDNLTEFAKLKVLPPPKGVNVGSLLGMQRAGAGAAIGEMVGGHTGAVIGSGIGVLTPPIVSRIVQSKAGTAALANILKRDGTVTPEHVAGIMAVIRGEQALADGLPDEIKKMLKGRESSIDEKIQGVNMQDEITKSSLQGAAALK